MILRRNLLRGIPDYRSFQKIKPLKKGWSGDKKYTLQTADGHRLLLRTVAFSEYESKKAEFGLMQSMAAQGIPMQRPLDFGICSRGKSVYTLLTWIDGTDAGALLPRMSAAGQVALGIKAGQLLQKIHSVPAPRAQEDWGERFYRKTRTCVDAYRANPACRHESGEQIIFFLEDNRQYLDGRAQAFLQGDFNKTNLIVSPDGETISVIDFNVVDLPYGDPYWAFDFMAWDTEAPAHFYTGLARGYFGGSNPRGGEPPQDFFDALRYYIAYDIMKVLSDQNIKRRGQYMNHVERWLVDIQAPYPAWYLPKEASP